MVKISKTFFKLFLSLAILFSILYPQNAYSSLSEQKHKVATSSAVINYARNLLLTIVDSNFRGSWVIDPDNWDKASQTTQKIQKSFDTLAQIKIKSSAKQVKEILKNPVETRNNGKIWVYGTPKGDGTYQELLEVFFDEKLEHVIGVISFSPKNIVENIGVNIGDQIDKMISAYGEPVDEKDFIEDPDNKDYLGLYYLYPRSGLGFLIGQDQSIKKNLIVKGVIVFGKG